MSNKPKVVCLCGSTKFKGAFIQATKDETLKGCIVLGVGLFGHADSEPITPATKQMLDELHRRKIDLADEILVLNVGGYIGESTRGEIEYARAHDKGVRYLEDEEEGYDGIDMAGDFQVEVSPTPPDVTSK